MSKLVVIRFIIIISYITILIFALLPSIYVTETQSFAALHPVRALYLLIIGMVGSAISLGYYFSTKGHERSRLKWWIVIGIAVYLLALYFLFGNHGTLFDFSSHM